MRIAAFFYDRAVYGPLSLWLRIKIAIKRAQLRRMQIKLAAIRAATEASK